MNLLITMIWKWTSYQMARPCDNNSQNVQWTNFFGFRVSGLQTFTVFNTYKKWEAAIVYTWCALVIRISSIVALEDETNFLFGFESEFAATFNFNLIGDDDLTFFRGFSSITSSSSSSSFFAESSKPASASSSALFSWRIVWRWPPSNCRTESCKTHFKCCQKNRSENKLK